MEFATVDDYIASQPAETQPILQEVRRRFHEAVPGAGEMISYGIPTITLDGHYVVYFAGWKHHLSVYPVPHGDEELQAEMKDAPDRLQWAMNHCLAQIGIEHAEHRSRAIEIGERLEVLKDYPTPPNCTSPFAPIWITEMVRRKPAT